MYLLILGLVLCPQDLAHTFRVIQATFMGAHESIQGRWKSLNPIAVRLLIIAKLSLFDKRFLGSG